VNADGRVVERSPHPDSRHSLRKELFC
jgi:hypothetical protein